MSERTVTITRYVQMRIDAYLLARSEVEQAIAAGITDSDTAAVYLAADERQARAAHDLAEAIVEGVES
jgi:diketogulonate reductase-like aldo/keto reductase